MGRHAGEPTCPDLDRADAEGGLEWLGRHARDTGDGVTLVFGDGRAARLDARDEAFDVFGRIVGRLTGSAESTATNSAGRS